MAFAAALARRKAQAQSSEKASSASVSSDSARSLSTTSASSTVAPAAPSAEAKDVVLATPVAPTAPVKPAYKVSSSLVPEADLRAALDAHTIELLHEEVSQLRSRLEEVTEIAAANSAINSNSQIPPPSLGSEIELSTLRKQLEERQSVFESFQIDSAAKVSELKRNIESLSNERDSLLERVRIDRESIAHLETDLNASKCDTSLIQELQRDKNELLERVSQLDVKALSDEQRIDELQIKLGEVGIAYARIAVKLSQDQVESVTVEGSLPTSPYASESESWVHEKHTLEERVSSLLEKCSQGEDRIQELTTQVSEISASYSRVVVNISKEVSVTDTTDQVARIAELEAQRDADAAVIARLSASAHAHDSLLESLSLARDDLHLRLQNALNSLESVKLNAITEMDGLRDQNETIEAKLRDAEASLKDFADVKHRLKDELKCLSAEKEMLEVRVGVLEAKLAEAVEVTEVRGREMTLLLAKKDEDARECEFKLEESLEKQRDAETRILELEAQLRNTNELLEDIQGTHETALAAQTAIADVCRHKLAESEALAREWGDALQRAETEAVRAQVVHERAVAEAREEVEHAKAMVSKLEGRVAEITADLETAQDKCNAILIDKADMWDAQIRKVQESLRAAESEKVKVKMAGDTECEKLQRMLEEKERDLVEVEALVRPLFGWMERLTESRKSAEE